VNAKSPCAKNFVGNLSHVEAFDSTKRILFAIKKVAQKSKRQAKKIRT